MAALPHAEAAAPRQPDDWQILRVLGLYRIVLAGALLVLELAGIAPGVLGIHAPLLFEAAAVAWVAVAVVLAFLVHRRWPDVQRQAWLQFGADLAALLPMTYASGGVGSGLAVLLVTPAVACALVMGLRNALLLAAVASLALFAEEFWRQSRSAWDAGDITQTGIIGAILMITALAASLVAARARASEARVRAADHLLASMARLNQTVLELLDIGVLVVDADGRIRTHNAAARRLLGMPPDGDGVRLEAVSPLMAERLRAWRERGEAAEPVLDPSRGTEVMPRFTPLGREAGSPVLVAIEDTAELRRHAQQIKLAALGRLSASIAHEIRNPLSAILQAGQLLAEDAGRDAQTTRLLDLILRHSQRIERIVTDVLTLSRRDAAREQPIALSEFLAEAARVWREARPGRSGRLHLEQVDAQLVVRFDPDHLQQILHNLWDNALAHGGRTVTVRCAAVAAAGLVRIDIADDGPGVPEALREQVFEPFFTTAHGGTGLGLFIARELCEYNRARLLLTDSGPGAVFRILARAAGPAMR